MAASPASARNPIDRRALVTRHNPALDRLNANSPLSVGNGEFAFTADITGLQTFPELYEKTTPLCAQSQWGWHSFPNPQGFALAGFHPTLFDSHGRQVGYPIGGKGQEEAFQWLRDNPHRLNLGRIGLRLKARADELTDTRQTLDLWNGILRSSFHDTGSPVSVETCCHPSLDMLAVRIAGDAPVVFEFPYASTGMDASNWSAPERHRSELEARGARRVNIRRVLDGDSYSVAIAWSVPATFKQEAAHRFVLSPQGTALEFVCLFSRAPAVQALPSVRETQISAARYWNRFWSDGGALELAHAPDPRAKELERRVVLSQYLTAIQCAGSLPPQETGLTCNSWNGKFHMEMYLWHSAQFALWNRTALLERSMGFYHNILASARNTARQQVYAGARWPKMTAADGRESPSPIGPLLIWQQPHPIWMAEAIYQARHARATLDRYAEVVFASAEFMASYACYDEAHGRYVLGPPVIPAQENHPPRETWNPAFELEYWAFGLSRAQEWRKRLGLAPEPKWAAVHARLAALPVKDGVYLAHENCPQTYTERRDHPSMLAALGFLSGARVERETMKRTLHKVLETWKFADTWGWDYPMIAMTAARVGEPETAIDALMLDTPKNRWSPNGHTWQRANLPVYLPSNGALLMCVAMMAASGFPASWNIRAERLRFIG
jgi:hypothetical protein